MDQSSLFQQIAPASRLALHRLATHKTFRPGETLFAQGQPPRSFFLLLRGRIKVWRTNEDGSALTLTLLGARAPFGTLAATLDRPNNATATALDEVTAAVWPIDDLRRIMATDPALTANVLRTVTAYAERLIEQLGEVAAIPVEQRLARTLLRLSGHRGDAPPTDELLLSRQDLADLVSTTLPTVSRIMSRWRADGLIDGGGRGRVRLLRIDRLEQAAGWPAGDA